MLFFADEAAISDVGAVGALGTVAGAIAIGATWLVSNWLKVSKDRREGRADEAKLDRESREQEVRLELEREKFRVDTETRIRNEWRETMERMHATLRSEINDLRERLVKAEKEAADCEKRCESLRREFDQYKQARG